MYFTYKTSYYILYIVDILEHWVHAVRITRVVCLFVTGYQTFINKALDDGGSVEHISNISTEFKKMMQVHDHHSLTWLRQMMRHALKWRLLD
jgi:hypothetical protein